MRIGLSSAVAGLLAAGIAVPASAQEASEPSVEGYLCIFAGKCEGGDEATEAGQSEPYAATGVSEGFRIARPGGETQQVSARPKPPRTSAGTTVRTPPPPRVRDKSNLATSSASVAANSPVAGTRTSSLPRADLRIGFELNSSRLTADGEKKARIFAQSLLMPELSGKRFLIEGHTDSGGAMTLNMNLSQQRAQAVADFLAQQGVDRSRMQVRGYGPGNPLSGLRSTDTRNRRVEAKLIS